MKYYHRRIEIGKMFVDVVKYMVTIIIIGGIFTDSITSQMAFWGIFASMIFLVSSLFTIPLNKEV